MYLTRWKQHVSISWILCCPKRNGLLSELDCVKLYYWSKQKKTPHWLMLDLLGRKTYSAYQHFYQCYNAFIIKSLEVISMGLHSDELSGNLLLLCGIRIQEPQPPHFYMHQLILIYFNCLFLPLPLITHHCQTAEYYHYWSILISRLKK